jgi:hypothetical protein
MYTFYGLGTVLATFSKLWAIFPNLMVTLPTTRTLIMPFKAANVQKAAQFRGMMQFLNLILVGINWSQTMKTSLSKVQFVVVAIPLTLPIKVIIKE